MNNSAPKGAGFFTNIKNGYMLGINIQHIPPRKAIYSMTMSPADIIAYGQKLPKKYHNLHVYYIRSANEHETILSTIELEEYAIPTGKLSDIHAILHVCHPNNDYYIQYHHRYIPHNNIITTRSYPTDPHIILLQRLHAHVHGQYNINIDRITPINCRNISLKQAVATGFDQIHAQFHFMQDAEPNTYNQLDITQKIHFPNHPKTYIQLYIYNPQYETDIVVNINIYHQNKIQYTESFALAPNNLHIIESLANNAGNNILAHISNNRDIYSTSNDSEHHYIELLRAVQHYCSRDTHGLTTQIQRYVQHLLQHYTYQP